MSASQRDAGQRIGVYVCHCGTNIAKTVDVEAVAAAAAEAPSVVVARHYKFMCSDPGQELIQRDVRELGLTRVVVAACSLLGYLIVRGSFETVGLTVTGLAFGLALSAALDRTPARDDGRQAGVVTRPADATAAARAERAAQRAEVD